MLGFWIHRHDLLRAVGVGGIALVLAVAPSAKADDPATPMYQPDTVDAIELTLPEASIEALENDPEGEYVEGTFSLATTDGAPDGVGPFSAPITVGIRLKGSVGSFRSLSEKAAFKIKFNYVKGQKFLGLKKMTLNNMVQDPSMIHETLAYQAFRSVGVVSPRTGYAYVRVNGENYGLYLNIETPDDVALEKHFGPFQHLYEGGSGTDVTPGNAGAFEIDEGDEDDRSDLEALIAAVNGTEPADFSTRVEPFADLAEMTRMWAVEKYIGHWDGYSGEERSPLPNNYYLFSDLASRFQMLPWGADQTWGSRLEFDGKGGDLFNRCLEDESCAALYRNALRAGQGSIAALDLDSLATCVSNQLAPWQEMEAAPRREYDAEGIEEGVEETRDFIAERPGELTDWLATQPSDPGETTGSGTPVPCGPPEPPALALSPEAAEVSNDSPPPASTPPVPRQAHFAVVKVIRSTATSGVLSTHLRLQVAGRIGQTATIHTAHGTLQVCTVRARARPAGPLTLHCRLSAATRHRLRARWLKLRVATRFEPEGGKAETIGRKVFVPERRP